MPVKQKCGQKVATKLEQKETVLCPKIGLQKSKGKQLIHTEIRGP